MGCSPHRVPRARAGAAPPGLLLAALALLVLAGCGSSTHANTSTSALQRQNGCTVVSLPKLAADNQPKPTALLAPARRYDVTFATNCGAFTIRIDQAQSPHAAASFVALAQHGFFDKTIFHRIAPGFVIQGGDPTGSGAGGPGYTTVDPPPANAGYVHGVVAMAKTSAQAPGAAGSQFFVVTEANAGLPADYAIIGRVTSGLAVVDRIGTLGNASQQPTMVVEIERASVTISG
jgi:peptidyl-prolyl cis-trans isomerase B (cyclophilin B)